MPGASPCCSSSLAKVTLDDDDEGARGRRGTSAARKIAQKQQGARRCSNSALLSSAGWCRLLRERLDTVRGRQGACARAHPRRSAEERLQSNIAWERCTDNTTFDCAFVDVPFSYDAEIQAELGNRQFSLAVRRLRGHSTKGTILTNPGGPGGSGVDDLLESGPRIARITGGQYDVLSWDPRGVQYTVPALNCTPEWSHSLLAGWSLEELPRPDTVPHGAARAATAARDATIGARADDCIMRTDKAVLESIGTLNTVRDMKRLAEHLGEGDSVKYWG